ncbi:MAG: hypothetical protein NZ602_09270 [Thermoguttaceae bacterium]|nr:hypothetical protein [Thermoguttaceae bacterium]
MEEQFGVAAASKAQALADAINRLLDALVDRCAKGEEILDRYFIGVLGYGGDVRWALGGALQGWDLAPVSEIGRNPLRIETRVKREYDGAGGLIEAHVDFPIWFEAQAAGGTPMGEALRVARDTVARFLSEHPACFPPIVINITDGEATDATDRELEQAANELRGLRSQDGNVLLFNAHISSTSAHPILFPTSEQGLPDPYARLLFRMSSPLPPSMLQEARI